MIVLLLGNPSGSTSALGTIALLCCNFCWLLSIPIVLAEDQPDVRDRNSEGYLNKKSPRE